MVELSVVCDCKDCEEGRGQPMTLDQFRQVRAWSRGVEAHGHAAKFGIFATVVSKKDKNQVVIEAGKFKGQICKHGLAALQLLPGQKRVLFEHDLIEKTAASLVRGGAKPKVYRANDCVSVVCW